MNRQEIKEIRNLYNIEDCPVNVVYGCYVNGQKDMVSTWRDKFLAQDEETMFKYLSILKSGLSGAKDKTLFDIRPSEKLKQELHCLAENALDTADETAGDMLENLVLRAVEAYDCTGSCVILLFHGIYDIPGKEADGSTMEDATDEVFDYIHMCICPVRPSKPGLSYDRKSGKFTHSPIMQELGNPDVSLMYPAFNGRSGDRDEALLYAKNLDERKKKFTELFTGFTIALSPDEQRNAFRRIISRVLGYGSSISRIKDVETEICILADEMSEGDDKTVGTEEIRALLDSCGVAEEKTGALDKIYAEELGSGKERLSIENIISRNGIRIKTGDGITIRSETITGADITTAVSDDGKPVLAVYLSDGDIEVNGLEVHIG